MTETDEDTLEHVAPVDDTSVWADIDISERDLWDMVAEFWADSSDDVALVEDTDTALDTTQPAQLVPSSTYAATETRLESDSTANCKHQASRATLNNTLTYDWRRC
jgi:hypothetical protein